MALARNGQSLREPILDEVEAVPRVLALGEIGEEATITIHAEWRPVTEGSPSGGWAGPVGRELVIRRVEFAGTLDLVDEAIESVLTALAAAYAIRLAHEADRRCVLVDEICCEMQGSYAFHPPPDGVDGRLPLPRFSQIACVIAIKSDDDPSQLMDLCATVQGAERLLGIFDEPVNIASRLVII